MSDTDTLLPNGKGVWIPIDHGVSDFPVKGLENLDELIPLIAHADAIVAQKGVVSRYAAEANFVATSPFQPDTLEQEEVTRSCWQR